MNKTVKKALLGIGGVILLGLGGGGLFVWNEVRLVNASLEKVYDVPAQDLKIEASPEMLARGKHLATSLGSCSMTDCHGSDLAGGREMNLGPMGTMTAPNITPAGVAAAYSDGELARLIQHGLKKDGTSLQFMPAHEVNWLPDSDVQAIVAYVRTVKPVNKPNGPFRVGLLAKILDRQDAFVLDVARRIDHENRDIAPPPAPTAAYGEYIGRLCLGCHGETLSGGPLPGAPPELPIPLNLTPHETGMKSYTYEDFIRLLETGTMKNGKKLDKFMPYESLKNMDSIERKALWEYLRALPPIEFGNR